MSLELTAVVVEAPPSAPEEPLAGAGAIDSPIEESIFPKKNGQNVAA